MGLVSGLAISYGCMQDGESFDKTDRGAHVVAGSCASGVDACGGQSDDGCWCDDGCEYWGDCCDDKADVCDAPPVFCADGDIVEEPSYVDGPNSNFCKETTTHCLTRNLSNCPQVLPPPCVDGHLVAGKSTFVPSTDGKECEITPLHCVTDDNDACPQFAPPIPGVVVCFNGTFETEPAFLPSTDGKECFVPKGYCVASEAQCAMNCNDSDEYLVTETLYSSIGGGLACETEQYHCLGGDALCVAPLAFPSCPDGHIVDGPPSYYFSSGTNECEVRQPHCVTNNSWACPAVLRAPCPANSTLVVGDSTFVPSADGMECEISQTHCVPDDATCFTF